MVIDLVFSGFGGGGGHERSRTEKEDEGRDCSEQHIRWIETWEIGEIWGLMRIRNPRMDGNSALNIDPRTFASIYRQPKSLEPYSQRDAIFRWNLIRLEAQRARYTEVSIARPGYQEDYYCGMQ